MMKMIKIIKNIIIGILTIIIVVLIEYFYILN